MASLMASPLAQPHPGLCDGAEEGSAPGTLGLASFHWALQPHQHPPCSAGVSSTSSVRSPGSRGLKQENEIFRFPTQRSNRLEVTLFLQFHLLQLGHGGGAGGLPIILIRGAPRAAKLQPRAGSSPGSCWLIMNIFMAAQPGLARLLLPEPCSLRVFWALAGSLQKTSPSSEVWWVLPKR